MTKNECAIVMVYTGVCMLQGNDLGIFYKYVEKLLGRPILTHELSSSDMDDKIKQLSKSDFLKLCETAT